MAANQIFQELDLPLEAWILPKWVKSTVKFAQRGQVQLVSCALIGLLAFPFALIGLIGLLGWRLLVGRFRR